MWCARLGASLLFVLPCASNQEVYPAVPRPQVSLAPDKDEVISYVRIFSFSGALAKQSRIGHGGHDGTARRRFRHAALEHAQAVVVAVAHHHAPVKHIAAAIPSRP